MGGLAERLRPRGALWRNGDFLWFWAAQSISQFGSQITSDDAEELVRSYNQQFAPP